MATNDYEQFVAIGEFMTLAEDLSRKTQAMVSVFLISITLGSIGIIAGSVKGLHNESGDELQIRP